MFSVVINTCLKSFALCEMHPHTHFSHRHTLVMVFLSVCLSFCSLLVFVGESLCSVVNTRSVLCCCCFFFFRVLQFVSESVSPLKLCVYLPTHTHTHIRASIVSPCFSSLISVSFSSRLRLLRPADGR